MNARFLLATATALACVAGIARADETPSSVLRYTRAELTNPDGARRLYSRIQSVAGQVCAAQDGASLDRKLRFASCRNATVDRAVAVLDAPLVSALHFGGALRLAEAR